MATLSEKAALGAVLVTEYEGEMTVKEYLKLILTTFWKDKPEFSGKRPFGESNPESYIDKAFIQAKLVKGDLDEDGFVNHVDKEAVDAIVLEIIRSF